MGFAFANSLMGLAVTAGLLGAVHTADAAMQIYNSPNINSPTQGGYYDAYIGSTGSGGSFDTLPPWFLPGASWSQAGTSVNVSTPQFTSAGFSIGATHVLVYSSANPANNKMTGFLYFTVDAPTDITFTGNYQGTSVSGTGNGGSTLAISLVTLNSITEAETTLSQKSSSLLSAALSITATLQPNVIYGVKFSEVLARTRSGTGSTSGTSSFNLTTAPAAVPEPASAGIIGTAAAALMLRRRKNNSF